jgi:hypothetical protein
LTESGIATSTARLKASSGISPARFENKAEQKHSKQILLDILSVHRSSQEVVSQYVS